MMKASKPVLLDVNVLVALGWQSHPFHALVYERMERQHGPWFTCALTQLGFIRLSANPAVTRAVVTASQAAGLLARLVRDEHHRFAPEVVPLQTAALASYERLLGSQQVTDAYLLAISAQHGATFLTLDSRVTAVARKVADLEVLQPY
jgi:toxin-antitoxin system PIN domain toxin